MANIAVVPVVHFVFLMLLASYMALESPSSWRQWREILLDEEVPQQPSWFSWWPWQGEGEDCQTACIFIRNDAVLLALLLINAGLSLMLWVAVAKRVFCLLIMWLLAAFLEMVMALAAVSTLLLLDFFNCVSVCNATGTVVASTVAAGVLMPSWLVVLTQLEARKLGEPEDRDLPHGPADEEEIPRNRDVKQEQLPQVEVRLTRWRPKRERCARQMYNI